MTQSLIIEVPDSWVIDVDMINEEDLKSFLDDQGALEGEYELGDDFTIEGPFEDGSHSQVHKLVRIDSNTVGLLSDDTYALFPDTAEVEDMDCIPSAVIREIIGNEFSYEKY